MNNGTGRPKISVRIPFKYREKVCDQVSDQSARFYGVGEFI